ncbi:molecular chaperone DnaJ [bacterium]|nr:molecular chaperone DnaJ [bacterium]
MSPKTDYYELLGVARDASASAIKKAYRKLAIKHHPDRNPDDPQAGEKFREATEAYEILKDPQQRAKYDQFGHAAFDQSAGFGGAGGFGGGFDINDALESFLRNFGGFGDIFGGAGGPGGGRDLNRGRDLQIKVKLTLEEAAEGVSRKIKLSKQVACKDCKGSGAAPGSRPQACSDCNGLGRVRQVRRSLLGQMVTEGICPRCQGSGSLIGDPCGSCHGTGTVRGKQEVEVRIPAGVSTGNYMDLAGHGDEGERGGAAGNLRVVMEVAAHEFFERHGDDLLIDLPVSPVDLMLGVKAEVPTLEGRVALKIPAGTQSHKIFRLRGKGMPRLNRHGVGDQLVRVIAWTPEDLSGDEKQRLEALRDVLAARTPAPSRRLFD